MKHLLMITLMTLGSWGFGQTKISLSYLNPAGPEIGFNSGIRYLANKDSADFIKASPIFELSIHWISRNNFHYTLGSQIEFGYRFMKNHTSNWQHELSISSGYQNRQDVSTLSISLQGDVTEKERESRNYILTLANYSIRRRVCNDDFIFFKGSYGYRFRTSDIDLSQQQVLFQIGYVKSF